MRSSQRKTPLILNKLIHNFLELFPQGSVPVTMKLKFTFLLVYAFVFAHGEKEDLPDLWNEFRGPNGSGIRMDAKIGIPSMQELLWKTPLPFGLSCPVLSEDKIFLTGFKEGLLLTIALDRMTGEIIWQRKAPEVEIEKFHASSSPATPTPFVEQNRLYVYFGSYGLLCYDHNGKELWKKPLSTPKSLYGTACSPIVYNEMLILVADDDANLPDSKVSRSKILAINKKDGSTIWQRHRPFHRSGWSTPAIFEKIGGAELVVLGNGSLRGYSMPDGQEKWQVDGFSRETIARPMIGNGKVYGSGSRLGGSADLNTDPLPFWNAVIGFDRNGDGRLERKEMTGHFTFPFRPQLPPGHPGYGLPLPKDSEKKRKRLDAMFGWIDKNRDGFWDKEEFLKNLTIGKGKPLLVAVKPGGAGNVTDSHIQWEFNKGIPEVPSPILYDDLIYMVSNGGVLTCLSAGVGQMVYRKRLPGMGQYVASPVVAGQNLIFVSEEGLLSVVRAGKEFKLLGQLNVKENIRVTPAVGRQNLYLRGDSHLWAFGK